MRQRAPLPAFLLLLLVSVLAPVVGADDQSDVRPVVLVLMRSSSGEEFESLRLLIVDAIRLELTSRELQPATTPDVPRPSDDPLALAKREGADFALWGTYELKDDNRIAVELRLLDAAGRSGAAVTRTGPLDFTFDALVAGAIGEAVAGQREALAKARTVRAEAARLAAAERAAAEKAAAEHAAAEKAAAEKAAAEKAAAERAAIEREAREKAEAEIMTRPVKHWGLLAGSGPFLATVEASQYFTLGLSLLLSGQYRFAVPGGLLGAGLATGMHQFRATGTAGEADSTLIPIGATLAYGTNTGSQFDFFAHVDGGAAVFVLQPLGGNAAIGVVPYALGGVGMTFAPFEMAGLAIDASYVAYFARGVPIMGFSPSLSVFLRF